MKIFRVLALTTVVASLSAFVASANAVTIGSKCVSNNGAPTTLFITGTASGESYVVPFNGIMTAWGTDRTSGSAPAMVAAILGEKPAADWKLDVVTPFQFLPVGTTAVSFPVRIPVTAGLTLGTTTYNSSAVMCSTGNASDTGGYGTAFAPGDTFTPTSISTYKNPVWATIEPDADGDGYGDETQDKCPQSAAFQNACPVLAISQKLSATSKQINVLATATTNTTLTATATVTIASKTTATFKSKATAISAGAFKTIKLTLPSSVKSALKKKSLKATVKLSGTGLANTATTTAKITLKKR